MIRVSMLARAVALTALAAAAGLCQAQAQAASSPAKKELVARVLRLQQPGIENMGNQMAAQASQQVMQRAGQAMQRVAPEKRELIGNEIQAEVRKFYEDIAPTLRATAVKLAPGTLGASLEEKLTEDELKALVAWLESPVSAKFQQVANENLQNMGQKLVADSRPTIEPKLRVLEQSLSKKLGLPAPDAAGPKASSAPAAKK